MNEFDRWLELLNDFFKKGRGLIDEFELLIYRLLEFLERLAIRLSLYGLLLYHIYVFARTLYVR